MHTSIKFLGALAVAGLIAAGGSAYTNSNTMAASQVVGYGSTTISGAVVSSMTYHLNTAGDNVDSVTLVLAGDTSASGVSIGFNGAQTTSCGVGAFTATFTTYTCNNGGSFSQATADLTSTAVIVN